VDNKNVFPVNDISFHQQYGTFSTAGGDGSIHFWDKDSKRSLKALTLPSVPTPITATSFNRNGTIFAYATGYDWHKGHEHSQQVFQSNLVEQEYHHVAPC
jgi:mRNA export factor